MEQGDVTFSFGENWQDYLSRVAPEDVEGSKRDIEEWLGADFVKGKTVLDIGSGSGIHSLSFYLLGARAVHSFDLDRRSVAATESLWEQQGRPGRWRVGHGSVLDENYLASLEPSYDIVYSWGVLHQTGSMWQAVDNAMALVKPGGSLWISLYTKGPLYPKHLALKQRYNKASRMGKRWMVSKRLTRSMLGRAKRLENPFAWKAKKARGMNVYNDIVDWLGGLPHEVASQDEVVRAGQQRGLSLEKVRMKGEGGCSIYLLKLPLRGD